MSSSAEKPGASRFREWIPASWTPPRFRWSRRRSWAALVAGVVTGVYLTVGYFLVPGLIRSQATDWVKTSLGKTIAIGEVRFNPITFAVDANNLAIPASGRPMASIGHLRVRFSILSLLGSTYDFNEIRVDRPYVDAIVRRDRSLNLIELLPRKKSKTKSTDVWIGTFSVNQGRVVFTDDSRPDGLKRTLLPVAFTLKDFQTNRADGGAFSFNAATERGERFDWAGTVSIAPIASEGRLDVRGLQSDTVQRLAGRISPVALTAGQISFSANYRFAYRKDGLQLGINGADLATTGLALAPKPALFGGRIRVDGLNARIDRVAFAEKGGAVAAVSAAMPRLTVRSLSVAMPGAKPGQAVQLKNAVLTKTHLDYRARSLDIGTLTVAGADVAVRRTRAGSIDLLSLLPEKAQPAASEVPVPQARPWHLSLGMLTLTGATLRFDDEAVTPQAHLAFTAINATAKGLGTDLSRQANVRFDGRVGDAGNISVGGVVASGERIADLTFTVAGLPLPPLAGYVRHNPDLQLHSGTASGSGTLHFEDKDSSALRFAGDASIDGLDLRERTTGGSLFAWHSFALQGIDYKSGQAEIGHGTLTRPFGRVAVLPNRTFNYMVLMDTGASAAATAGPPTKARPSVRFTMKRLDIDHGTMSFADYSIQPNFSARIQALGGSIVNLSNSPDVISTIDLKGHVIDRFSPVTIKGTMSLLGYDRKTNMHLAFRNIELPIFNPYSGRYAGYAISKGKLTTELTYTIKNRALKADHHIVVDQLDWGKATATKEAVPYPIRLATALLKDSNGVIDIDVPLTGSLDDPQFRVGPLVWQVVGNILEKAATAPFRLIGSLFAGADKAQYIDFAPGSTSLPPGSSDALGALAKALVQRPALKLDIPAGPAIAADADGLADARIDALLMEKEAKSGKPVDVTTLDAGDVHDRLEDLYREKFGKRPEYPEFSPDALKAAQNGKPDLSDSHARAILEAQWTRSQLRTKFAPSRAELEALGTARATAIRNALLASGTIDPARLFVATEAQPTPADGHSRVELKFE